MLYEKRRNAELLYLSFLHLTRDQFFNTLYSLDSLYFSMSLYDTQARKIKGM